MKTKFAAAAIALAGLIGLGISSVPGCGGGEDGGRCGNGELESGESCDDGNTIDNDSCSNRCTIIAPTTTAITIRWPINEGKFTGMPSEVDTCGDVGATHAIVKLDGIPSGGGAPINRPAEEFGCDLGSNRFLHDSTNPVKNIVAGQWTAKVKLIKRTSANDAGVAGGDADLTREITLMFDVLNAQRVDQSASFGIADFLMSYTGGLQFRTNWGAATSCTAAVPPVTQQLLLLKRKLTGAVIAKMTIDNVNTVGVNEAMPTDATAPGICVDSSGISQQIFDLEWGEYTLGVKGLASGGTTAFCNTFDVFVGAQSPVTTNPSYRLMVPTFGGGGGGADASVPDGGFDGAMPDGGMSIVCF